MDTKNVIAAITLSSAIIILWSLFMIPDQPQKKDLTEKDKVEQNTDTPSLEQKETLVTISREEALKENTEAIIAEGFDRETVYRVLRLVDINEYKRRQAPIGTRITERGFGRDRRYPITQKWPIGD